MYDSILIATDGSDRTRSAVAHGLGLAETYGATVHALYVVDTMALSLDDEEFGSSDHVVDLLAEKGRQATEEIRRRATERGVDTETSVTQGRPAKTIRQYAEREAVDLIAMGTQGRSGLARYLLGSVAESVLRNATPPVLAWVVIPDRSWRTNQYPSISHAGRGTSRTK